VNVTVARRSGVIVLLGVAAVLYAWAASRTALEPYYEAAVRSMAGSWHDFAYGALDPAGTVSLDKLPGAFWLQALAVRAFGFHSWAIILPQVVEGVLTVGVLYWAVRRLAGPAAGFVAAAVLALSPATVALNRGNISDSLTIMLLVLAAAAVSAAVTSGQWVWLILAGVFVGLAFQAKMLEAWLVLPALGVAYLLDGPGSLRRRASQLAAGGAVAAAVSLVWMAAISLVPAGHRPYVDGSRHDSIFDQVFSYNGFGRFGDSSPLQLLAGQQLNIDLPQPSSPGLGRLFHGDLGRDVGWLLPFALVAAVWALASRARARRGDGLRACLVLWTTWLLVLGLTFSITTDVNAYYTAALAPAIAAVLGAAVAVARAGQGAARPSPLEEPGAGAEPGPGAESGESGSTVEPDPVTGPPATAARSRAWSVGLAVVVAASAAWAAFLIPAHGSDRPGWLVPLVIAVGAAATLVALAAALRDRPALLTGALAGALVTGLVAPTVASVELTVHHRSAFDTPFEPVSEAAAITSTFVQEPASVRRIIPELEAAQHGAPDLLAAQTAVVASVFIVASGREALPIGGFTGTSPVPTLAQLRADVRAGRFHLVLTGASRDPRIAWITSHCLPVNTRRSPREYYCLPASAAGSNGASAAGTR